MVKQMKQKAREDMTRAAEESRGEKWNKVEGQ